MISNTTSPFVSSVVGGAGGGGGLFCDDGNDRRFVFTLVKACWIHFWVFGVAPTWTLLEVDKLLVEFHGPDS